MSDQSISKELEGVAKEMKALAPAMEPVCLAHRSMFAEIAQLALVATKRGQHEISTEIMGIANFLYLGSFEPTTFMLELESAANKLERLAAEISNSESDCMNLPQASQ